MADPILRLITDFDALGALEKELERAAANVRVVGVSALEESLKIGKIQAEDIANAYWNGIDTWVEENTYLGKINKRKFTGSVKQSGRKIELHRFMSAGDMAKQYYAGDNVPTVRPPGVFVAPYKDGNLKLFPGTFIQKMRSGFFSVFKRTSENRLPIKVQYAKEDLNYPLLQEIEKFEREATETFEKELNLAIDEQGVF
jgi:hypothetical protein